MTAAITDGTAHPAQGWLLGLSQPSDDVSVSFELRVVKLVFNKANRNPLDYEVPFCGLSALSKTITLETKALMLRTGTRPPRQFAA
jgi:hypothetical protein